jgi:gas vesicle protein
LDDVALWRHYTLRCISLTQGATIQLRYSLEGINMSDRDGNSFVWFLAGLGLGALAGVLYAPRSGSETREVLRARAEEGRNYMRDRAREARSQASQWADRGREVVSQQKEQFRAAYEAGRQAYHEATADTGAPKNL